MTKWELVRKLLWLAVFIVFFLAALRASWDERWSEATYYLVFAAWVDHMDRQRNRRGE